MSEKPIGVGDLVQIVKPNYCCGSTHSIGYIFTVEVISPPDEYPACCACGGQHLGEGFAWQRGGKWSAQPSRLKRIPPLDEMEGVRTEENLKVPA